MTYFGDFTPDEERQLLDELGRFEQNRARYRATATPQLAQNVSQISQVAPHLGPEVVLPLAQGVTDGALPLEQAQQTALNTAQMVLTDPRTYEPPQNVQKGFLGRVQDAVTEKIKTGSRWTFAGLNLVPQLVTNLGARVYGESRETFGNANGPNYQQPVNDFDEGWFASTDLGAMLSGKDAGDGFFIGEEALKYQEEKVKQYRGTIAGNGWTLGRGVAMTAFQPGSRQYNILSGLVDAAAALAIPSVPGLRVAKSAITSAKEVAGLKTLAGLTNFEDTTIIRSKVSNWLSSDRGTALVDELVRIDDMGEALERFGNAPTGFLREVVGTTDSAAMREVLERNLGLTVTNIDDINIGRVSGWRNNVDGGRMRPVSAIGEEIRRLKATVPDRSIVINFDNELDNAKSLRDVNNYLKTLRVDEFVDSKSGQTVTRGSLLQRLADLSDVENFGDFRNTMDLIDDAIVDGLSKTGRFKGQQEAARQSLRYIRQKQESSLFGRIDDEGASNIYGLKDPNNKLEVINAENGETFMAPMNTAAWMSEERRYAAFLPDPRALRRTTSRMNWIFEKDSVFARNPEVFGEARLPVAFLEWVQNQVWRPLTLATGGYVLRNISESMIRSTMAPGIKTGPLHPFEWVMTSARRKFKGTITGVEYSDEAAEVFARSSLKEFVEATKPGLREMTDKAYLQRRARQTGAWAEASRAGDRTYYRQGLADNIQLASEDFVVREIAKQMMDGITDNGEIINWLRTTPEGKTAAKRLQARWTNAKPGDPNVPATTRVTYDFFREVDGQVVLNEANWNKYLNEFIRPSILDITGGDNTLIGIIANADMMGQFSRNGRQVNAFKYAGGQRGLPTELSGYDDEFLGYLDELLDNPAFANRLPERVKRRVNALDRGDPFYNTRAGEQIRAAMDRSLDHIFGNVYGAKEALLNRSPAFRQFYYRQVGNLSSELSRETAGDLVSRLKSAYAKDQLDFYEDLRKLRRIPAGTDETPIMYKFGGGSARTYTKAEWDELGADLLAKADAGDEIAKKRLKNYEVATRRSEKKPQFAEKYRIGDEVVDANEYKIRVEKAQKAANDAMSKFDDKWAEKWVGSKDLWQKIRGIADGTIDTGIDPKRGLSLEQIDAYARGFALDETKRLFYNVSETSNFADIMKIISPFGQAWAEVMAAWYKNVLTNPNRLKNFGVTFKGIRDSDPDGDGKGFIYKDPVTGEMMYNYPFVSAMAPLITGGAAAFASQALLGPRFGLRASGAAGLIGGAAYGLYAGQRAQAGGAQPIISAPVKSLNMALNVYPSVGPVVQIAANQILGDKPQFDDLRSILLPYGTYEPTPSGIAEQLTPSWAKKMIEAIRANPDNDRIFSDLYMDAYRALFATGQYDLNSTDDMQVLRERAGQSARYMLGLRSLGQFLGPARPDVQYMVPTAYKGTDITIDDVKYMVENGNIPNNVLAKAFRQFQEEDFENAVPRFLQTFGDQTMLYLRGTTESVSEGIEASETFGDWERVNGDFKDRNSLVYGYFAPTGSDFDLETYLRQIKSGERRRVTDPKELQADAEAVVGKALYRQMMREMGQDPTPQQTNMLKAYRAYLYQLYPGFQVAALDIRERPRIIQGLIDGANDAAMVDNPVGRGLRFYFSERDKMIALANQRRLDRGQPPAMDNPLSGVANADLRAYLRHTGDRLSLQPQLEGFERVWSRVMFDEVDVEA